MSKQNNKHSIEEVMFQFVCSERDPHFKEFSTIVFGMGRRVGKSCIFADGGGWAFGLLFGLGCCIRLTLGSWLRSLAVLPGLGDVIGVCD